MGRNWTRNLPLKIGALVVAIAGTLGFYGLIQAHPLDGQSTSAAATASSAAAAGDQQPATPAPTAASGDEQSQPIQQAPPQQTIPRHRVSRGS